jgi:hypothetical protein
MVRKEPSYPTTSPLRFSTKARECGPRSVFPHQASVVLNVDYAGVRGPPQIRRLGIASLEVPLVRRYFADDGYR